MFVHQSVGGEAAGGFLRRAAAFSLLSRQESANNTAAAQAGKNAILLVETDRTIFVHALDEELEP
jgi:hypothetical protein